MPEIPLMSASSHTSNDWHRGPDRLRPTHQQGNLMQNRKKTGVVAGTVIALTGASIAWAAWTSDGTGTGSATAGESQDFTISSTTISDVYPTGSFDTTITVSNPNPYKLSVSNLALDSVDSDDEDCNADDAASAEVTQLTESVDAEDSSDTAAVVSFSNDLNDACQGATLTLNWVAAGASSAS